MTDQYRHLLDGHEEEAASALDAYLSRATVAPTVAQGVAEGREAAPLRGI